MSDLRGGEEHRGGVRAGSDARAAADACGSFERAIRILLRDGGRVGVRGCTRVDGNVAASLNDAIQGGAVDHQVLDDREARRAPRFNRDDVAVLKGTHVQLAGRGDLRAVSDTVDNDATLTANALAAVGIEGDRFLASCEELFVQDVEHLQERGLFRDSLHLVFMNCALVCRTVLAPNPQCQVHL